MMQQKIKADPVAVRSEYSYKDQLLLSGEIHYPQFSSENEEYRLGKLNRLLMADAMAYQAYCAETLFNMAIEQYEDGLKHNYPFREFAALLTYEITDLSECIISLYQERYEFTGGAHGNTRRSSLTYNARAGKTVSLSSLITCRRDYKKYLLDEIAAQIGKEPSVYFDNANVLIADTFNPEQFYLTPRGVVIYYQQYDIAPYASGIREFLIPYSDCVKNPVILCDMRQQRGREWAE